HRNPRCRPSTPGQPGGNLRGPGATSFGRPALRFLSGRHTTHAVDDVIRQTGYHQLPRLRNLARPAHFRKSGEVACRGLDTGYRSLGGDGVKLPDGFADAMKVEERRLEPVDPHQSCSRAIRKNASTSSAEANLPASASATAFLICSICQRLISR